MIRQSLFLIKPNAVAEGHVGDIISIVEREHFRIKAMRMFRFDKELSALFYKDHLNKEFYPRLESFMCSGDTVAMILEKENAIHDLRELMGDVIPEKRKPGSIRALYGKGITDNGAHASDCEQSAVREIKVLFGKNI